MDYLFSAGVNQQTASIHVRLGNGKGKFQTSWKFGKYIGCADFAVGDFNEDGNLDFAALADSEVRVFLGNGDGTFDQGATYANLPAVFSPIVADFNGDGRLDLVVDNGGGALQILLGNGDGTFQSPQTILTATTGQALACGYGVPLVANDFNGDGKMDLALCEHSLTNSWINVLLGNGNGTFQKPLRYHAGTADVLWNFTAGDFNTDNKTDFIDWFFKNGGDVPVFATLVGNGDGMFQKQTPVFLPANIEEFGIVTGDWNSDGLLDFVMLPGAGGVEVYTQK